jgi:hypothetical protein
MANLSDLWGQYRGGSVRQPQGFDPNNPEGLTPEEMGQGQQQPPPNLRSNWNAAGNAWGSGERPDSVESARGFYGEPQGETLISLIMRMMGRGQ